MPRRCLPITGTILRGRPRNIYPALQLTYEYSNALSPSHPLITLLRTQCSVCIFLPVTTIKENRHRPVRVELSIWVRTNFARSPPKGQNSPQSFVSISHKFF